MVLLYREEEELPLPPTRLEEDVVPLVVREVEEVPEVGGREVEEYREV